MSWFKPADILDKVFEVSIVVKGVEGLLEAIGGVALLFVGAQGINQLVAALTQQELSEDPKDLIANFVLHTGQHVASGGTTTFLVAYLLVHGAIKIIAVLSLLKNQLWGYPFSLVTLGLFMGYQGYQVYEKFSLFLIVLTLFDVFLMWLIWREYQQQKLRLATRGKPQSPFK